MNAPTVTHVGLGLDFARRMHRTCEEFEAAWGNSDKPRIANALAGYDGAERAALLAELLALELELRRSGGEAPAETEYMAAFPAAADQAVIRMAFGDTLFSNASDATKTPDTASVKGYEILRELGRGGMGVVYLARDQRLKRLVALKMILAGEHSGSRHLARFRTEAELVARLQHPNIVQIFEVGESGGRPFLALEFIEGKTLSEFAGREPVSPRLAAELIQVLARAVNYAHIKGIVHRDLKPSNVLIGTPLSELSSDIMSQLGTGSASGQQTTSGGLLPKITDFGLAKDLAGEGDQTSTGAILGTPHYMSPEQADGHARDIGPAADIYALGAMLYGLLTGRPPFQGTSPLETIRMVLANEPVAPSQLQPGIPRDLQTICLKCLQKDPTRRYGSAAALAEDLSRFLADKPILAQPVGSVDKARRWCRRNPVVAGLTMLIFAVLVAGVVFSTHYALRADREAESAKTETARAEAMAQRARERAYYSDLRQVETAWHENTLGRIYELLHAQRPEQTDGVDLRNFEWHYWHRKALPPRLIGRHEGMVTDIGLSPDGRAFASTGMDRKLRLGTVEEGRELSARDTSVGKPTRVSFHPAGDRLLTPCEDGSIRVWTIADGTVRHWPAHTGAVRSARYDRDGTRIVSSGNDGTVRIWDANTLQPIRTLPGHMGAVPCAAFNAAGDRIISAGADKTARIWDAADGRELHRLSGHIREVSCAAFSPDGTTVATAGYDLTIRLWNTATGELQRVLTGHTWNIWSLAFSPDGQRLATANFDRTIKLWDVRTGEDIHTFKGHLLSVESVAFHPDGRRLVSGSADGTIRVATIPENDPHCITRHRTELGAVACSPDGRWLATAGGDTDPANVRLPFGELYIHDRTGREPIRVLEGHRNSVMCVGFSPDGRILASVSGVRDPQTRKASGELRIWNGADFKPFATIATLETTPCHLAISRDSQWIALGGRTGDLVVQRLPDGRDPFTLPGLTREVTAIVFSKDGRHLIAGGFDECVKVWNLESRAVVATLPMPQKVSCVAVSPDGDQFAVSDYSIDVHLCDTQTWQKTKSLRGHSGGVVTVVYSPDGKRIATAGEEFAVKVWDRATAQELLTLRGHTKVIRSIAFSPDGHVLYSGSWDRSVRIWDGTPGNSEKIASP